MRDFPQEIVDMIIDELHNLGEPTEYYSTISRKWLDRTQKHYFESPRFYGHGQRNLEKWRRVIKPDPLGVSRHVRRLSLPYIKTLKGFEEHIRAFTRIERAEFESCHIFRSLVNVQPLTLLGSSLVQLKIMKAKTTASVMNSLLAALPHLRRLIAYGLSVKHGSSSIRLPTAIPFFQGANRFELWWAAPPSPRDWDWIPPTAQFGNLRVAPICILWNAPVVNRWITSSVESLEYFCIDTILPDLYFGGDFTDHLDLSGCTSLKEVKFPVPITAPGKFAEIVLPSIHSPRLSTIILDFVETHIDHDWEPQDWGEMENHLCRLAKRFKSLHDGRLMTVEARVNVWEADELWERIQNEWPMPDLAREATIITLC